MEKIYGLPAIMHSCSSLSVPPFPATRVLSMGGVDGRIFLCLHDPRRNPFWLLLVRMVVEVVLGSATGATLAKGCSLSRAAHFARHVLCAKVVSHKCKFNFLLDSVEVATGENF